MDTEMGLFWKTKIEKMYKDVREMEVVFFSPKDETNIEKQFEEETAEDGWEFGEGGEDEGYRTDFHEPMVPAQCRRIGSTDPANILLINQ
ncbi:hypothetical protein PHJA_002580000 [Phtheirospermum japonicum]|uniref:Uncharacterized protein n=1 Tax=Phtheirospermum japonicum TaxID=374723 RepID=A0A830CWT2_9LAMI|nr:hypothetical protein PHJA_002580000 [Phtheirospermum japonicum]